MWSSGLLNSMKNPKYIVYKDKQIVIIKDMYPKAKYHLLVIPQEDVSEIRKVNITHLPLLKYMDQKGREIAHNIAPNVKFKYGYHTCPSMSRLHLHAISLDMISDALRTKKHYNSFTTSFFIKSKVVLNMLKEAEKLTLPSHAECENFLKQDLKCHLCGLRQANIPTLKKHLNEHFNSTAND